MAPAVLARRPAGIPSGGQFAAHERPESRVGLSRHTPVAGWDLRSFTALGTGTHGESWSAVLHRDGMAAVVVTDAGTGFGPETDPLHGETIDPLAAAADSVSLDVDEFVDVLRVSAEIDRTARAERLTRTEVIEMLAALGEIDSSTRDVLVRA